MHHVPTAPPRARSTSGTSTRGRRAAAAVAATLGAATLVSAVAPSPADAFTRHVGTVWGRVAACESSRNWQINTGNGYYGGLQFSRSTWIGYHGRKYAATANRATRAEQIEVARRVLAYQGRGAWPVCGPNAGLTKRTGGATRARLPLHAG
ncbi:MAG: resuscitation-promoting factor RpfA [Pseudonocardiales bacterium]|jgi:hypothetical protein|nr:resuscitation-promoting factor RpfA [Pseudonocardiales bacterium]MDT4941371.1 resuscitation-promoting factor RpfA [Pseudonocardiales bacterium]